jgi:hypothetical protein
MKLHQLIIEATPGQLVKQMPDKLTARWKQQTGEDIPAKDVMAHIVKLIPKDKTNTYIQWLTREFIRGELNHITDKDINDEVYQTINYHAKAAQSNNYIADPMKYDDFDAMYTSTAVAIVRNKTEAKTKKESDEKEVWDNVGKKGSGAEIEKWIEGKLYRCNSTRAIYALGSPQWCVSHGDQPEDVRDEHCIIYSDRWKETEPFFVIDLDDDIYGMYPGRAGNQQFVNYFNDQLQTHQITGMFEEEPDIYELIKSYITDDDWLLPDPTTPEGVCEILVQNFNGDGDDRWSDLDDDYVKELEVVVAKSAQYSYEYAQRDDDTRFPAGEKAIAGDTEYAYHYVKNVIRGRWKMGEVALRQDDIYWEQYLKMLDRWGVHDDVETELQNDYQPDPQMPLFSESFKQIIAEWLNN